jgi:hypothetical protein
MFRGGQNREECNKSPVDKNNGSNESNGQGKFPYGRNICLSGIEGFIGYEKDGRAV